MSPVDQPSGPEGLDMDALARAAKAGDVDALYKVAGIFSQANKIKESIEMLKRAAAGGHLDARYTLAVHSMTGFEMPQNMAHAADILEQVANAGHPAGIRLYNVIQVLGLGTERNWEGVTDSIIAGAVLGNPTDMRTLALLGALMGADEAEISALLLAAATRKDVLAGMQLVRMHMRGSDVIDAQTAKNWAEASRAFGHPLADDAVAALAVDVTDEIVPEAPLPTISDAFKACVKNDPLVKPLEEIKFLLDRPRVRIAKNLINPIVCDHLIAMAAPMLAMPSLVDPKTGATNPDPSQPFYSMAFWPQTQDVVVAAVNCRLAMMLDVPLDRVEQPSVHFFQTGMSRPRTRDFITVSGEHEDAVENQGQRQVGVYIPLASDHTGGAFRFSEAAYTPDCEDGDAVLFDVLLQDDSEDEQAINEVQTIEAGVKWNLSVFSHLAT